MFKEVEKVFERFGVTIGQVKERLNKAGCNEYVQMIEQPESKKILSHPLFFAMASLVLKDVKNVLEIGSGTGSGTKRLSGLFPDAKIYTIDMASNDPSWRKKCWRGKHINEISKFTKNTVADNIIFVESNSLFLFSLDLPEQFDFIFVDGDHHYPFVAIDTAYAYSRICTGGFLFMDNLEVEPKVYDITQMVDWLKNIVKEEILILPLYLNPPSFVNRERMAFLVKEEQKHENFSDRSR